MNEPAGTSPDRPVWTGRIVDLSAGGFSVRTTEESIRLLEPGYFVGTRLVFGVGQEAVYADASVRHIAAGEDGTVVGFQFLGLEYTDAGKQSLRTISRKVAEYQAAAPREEESDGDEAAAPAPAAPAAGSLEPPA
jgi:c-di-GMP-binding flagellar brake protein YcgR